MQGQNISKIWKTKGFRLLWIIGFLTSSARWLEIMTFSVLTWQWFGDATYAAVLFAIRMIAISATGIVFSLFSTQITGHKIMFFAQVSTALTCFISASLIYFKIEYALYGLCMVSLLSGALWSVDFSYRRRMLADTLTRDKVVSGLSLDVMSSHATRFIGMILGGIILGFSSSTTLFVLLTIIYLLACYLTLQTQDTANKISKKIKFWIESRLVFRQALRSIPILSVLLITPIFNIFALPYVALIPLIYFEQFNSTEFITGFLASFEGLGAILGALFISVIILKNLVVLFPLSLGMLLVIIFTGVSTGNIYLLTLSIIFTGSASSAYSAMQSSIIYTFSKERLRSASFSILTITIGTGFVGGLNISWMSGLFSVSSIARIIAIEGLLCLSLVYGFIFFLKSYRKKKFPSKKFSHQ